jgi:hypothetical protein
MTGNEAVTHTDSEKGIHLNIKFRIEKVGLCFNLAYHCSLFQLRQASLSVRDADGLHRAGRGGPS